MSSPCFRIPHLHILSDTLADKCVNTHQPSPNHRLPGGWLQTHTFPVTLGGNRDFLFRRPHERTNDVTYLWFGKNPKIPETQTAYIHYNGL